MTDEEEVALLLSSAIPIDGADQMLAPGLSFVVVWIDISGRPDLRVLAGQMQHASWPARGDVLVGSLCAAPGLQSERVCRSAHGHQLAWQFLGCARPTAKFLSANARF